MARGSAAPEEELVSMEGKPSPACWGSAAWPTTGAARCTLPRTGFFGCSTGVGSGTGIEVLRSGTATETGGGTGTGVEVVVGNEEAGEIATGEGLTVLGAGSWGTVA